MAIVRIDKEIFRRVQSVNSLAKGLADFIYCCQRDLHPPRIYKRSGMSADGSIACQPYYDLNLHHHHLHRDGDPLLVTQHIGEIIQSVALTTHQEYLHRDTLLW